MYLIFTKNNAAKMWYYCRHVYMPMSYIYGKRFVCPITPLIRDLREELFIQPYDESMWKKSRHKCAKVIRILSLIELCHDKFMKIINFLIKL